MPDTYVDRKIVLGDLDFRTPAPSREQWREQGKALREKTPRESHAALNLPANRPDPVATVLGSNRGRQKDLIPLRMARMAASPFTFLRGAAAVMACDLAKSPVMGHSVVIDGDAHLNNFGFYGTPQRDLVFDLNDFDEATFGPWEWDLKRLVASVNVAARENGLNRRERRAAVLRCALGYRRNMENLAKLGALDIWQLHSYADPQNPFVRPNPKTQAIVAKATEKARKQTNASLFQKLVENRDGQWRFRTDPAILTEVNSTTRNAVVDGLSQYSSTLLRERKVMLDAYHVADVAHRVVGVGSVGTRAYLALLMGRGDDDPLLLQIKEATPAAHSPYLPKLPDEFAHDGKRVVTMQRALQASTDLFLGWTTMADRPYYVRQMKNMKGGMPVEFLTGDQFDFYAWACGALLARAHARTGEPSLIAGYCGSKRVFDEALANWAEAYGDQNASDHAALVDAVQSGRVKAAAQA
jgi:uncharacterized protein (DUF2252 family)